MSIFNVEYSILSLFLRTAPLKWYAIAWSLSREGQPFPLTTPQTAGGAKLPTIEPKHTPLPSASRSDPRSPRHARKLRVAPGYSGSPLTLPSANVCSGIVDGRKTSSLSRSENYRMTTLCMGVVVPSGLWKSCFRLASGVGSGLTITRRGHGVPFFRPPRLGTETGAVSVPA